MSNQTKQQIRQAILRHLRKGEANEGAIHAALIGKTSFDDEVELRTQITRELRTMKSEHRVYPGKKKGTWRITSRGKQS